MRTLPPEVIAYLQGSGVNARVLVWIKARNRSTGATETIGIWNGDDNQEFVINGQTRLYYGAGGFISAGMLTLESTLNIRKFVVELAPMTPELETVLRQYDAKMAPLEVHVAMFSTETNNLIAPPDRIHKGWIDTFPLTTPPVGGAGKATINGVGHTRLLTKRLPLKRSDDSQRRRNISDSFFADVGITGQVQTPWGSK